MQDFRRLDIYKRAIDYCVEVYRFAAKLPSSEQYGLISQIQRAVTSIPLNISEGAGANSNKEFYLFITYSYRSANEVLTCLELIKKLGLSKEENKAEGLEKEGAELSRMIYAFSKKLKT